MARNNSRGTATSAIWKTICREWREADVEKIRKIKLLAEMGWYKFSELALMFDMQPSQVSRIARRDELEEVPLSRDRD
jgi:hypothetical protein